MSKFALTGSGVLAVAGVAAVSAAALYLVYKFKAGTLDPTSPDNAAYQGAGSVVRALTEGEEVTVGGLFARAREWLSGDDAKIRDMLRGSSEPTAGRTQTYDVLTAP